MTSYDAWDASKLVGTISGENGFRDSIPTGVAFGGNTFGLAVSAAKGSFGTSNVVIADSGSDDSAGSLIYFSNTKDGVGVTNSTQAQGVTIGTILNDSIVIAAHANNGNGSTAQDPLTSVLYSEAGSAGGSADYAITDPAVTGGTYSFSGSTSQPLTVAAIFKPIPEPVVLTLVGLGGLIISFGRGRRR